MLLVARTWGQINQQKIIKCFCRAELYLTSIFLQFMIPSLPCVQEAGDDIVHNCTMAWILKQHSWERNNTSLKLMGVTFGESEEEATS